mgnify:CR=1 FL=1
MIEDGKMQAGDSENCFLSAFFDDNYTEYTYKYKKRHKNYAKVQNNTTKVRITNGKMHNKNI